MQRKFFPKTKSPLVIFPGNVSTLDVLVFFFSLASNRHRRSASNVYYTVGNKKNMVQKASASKFVKLHIATSTLTREKEKSVCRVCFNTSYQVTTYNIHRGSEKRAPKSIGKVKSNKVTNGIRTERQREK